MSSLVDFECVNSVWINNKQAEIEKLEKTKNACNKLKKNVKKNLECKEILQYPTLPKVKYSRKRNQLLFERSDKVFKLHFSSVTNRSSNSSILYYCIMYLATACMIYTYFPSTQPHLFGTVCLTL
jgi:hypothetical protein